MYTWVQRVEHLLELAQEMRKDKDECLIIQCDENKEEILVDERDRFISLIPPEVPPTCRSVIIRHFEDLYAPIMKQGKVLCNRK